MSEQITIIEKAEQHALCVSETVGTMKLGKVMQPAYLLIMDHLKKHDINFGENVIPFARYKDLDWAKLQKKSLFSVINMLFCYKWQLDIGVSCPDSVPGEGRMNKVSLDAGKYIRMIHIGSYKKVGETYNRILAYATEQNLKVKNTSIEFYLNDPRETPTSQLETEVLVPVG